MVCGRWGAGARPKCEEWVAIRSASFAGLRLAKWRVAHVRFSSMSAIP